MILKSIEITGFKSFPEKIEIKLSPGLTVIVGPNGCGKSNLVDSVRWVLGEQSVKLMRGNRMEELIFSGTDQRKPLNYADVSVIFEEVDKFLPVEYQEVSVSRRMYRSGEGEYYLNKKPCRLKDITELFLDTGIGMETYSLIGQGRVEQLINARPEEHRELFEEAAKIHKYKQRKKEARGRLEEMHRNLLRVDDLLAEYQGQKEHLSEEVNRAKQYKILLDELKSVDKSILTRQWLENKSTFEKINRELNRISGTIHEKTESIRLLTGRLDKYDVREKAIQVELDSARNRFQEQKETIDSLQSQTYLIRQTIKYNMEKMSYKEESFEEVQGRISGLNDTIQKNEQELITVQEEQKHLGEKASLLNEQIKDIQRGNNMSLIESARESLSEKNQKKAALQQKIQDYHQRINESRQKNVEIEKLINNKDKTVKKLSEKQKQVFESIQQLQQEKFELEKEQEQLENNLEKNNAAISRKKQSLNNLTRDIEKKKTRFRYLKESEEDFSLFPYGVKSVMQWASSNSQLDGIFGPFIQLINVLPQYEKAIEVALGASMQFIVVSDENHAKQAIEHLKTKQAGKATFLPLNMLRVSKKESPSRSNEGFIERASQLVEAPSRFKKAVDYLLGGTLVARDLESAVKMARNVPSGWKIVTLEGEMITPGGAISGGSSSKRSGGFLASKRERESLEVEIQKLTQKENTELDQIEKLENQLKNVEEKLGTAKQKTVNIETLINKKQNELEHVEIDLKRESEEAAAPRREKEELDTRRKHMDQERLAREEELNTIENMITSLQAKIKELSQQVQLEEEQHKKIEEERVEIRVRFSACQEKESSLQDIVEKQRQEKQRLEELADSLRREKDVLQKELDKSQEEENSLLNRLEAEKAGSITLETEVEKLEETAKHIKLEKAEVESQIEKEKRSLERVQKRSQNLQFDVIRYKEASRYLSEQLMEKYQVNTENLSYVNIDEKTAEEELAQEKQRLENELADMGEVDLSVIDEFEKLQQRTHFLHEQKKDLIDGEKGVRSVLNELDQYMEKRFMEALHSIENNFMDIFKKLFGGGQALLKLTDPGNVLESGIEIVAQPPGKKLQTISLLSGGEKALTAIALLFALLHYKPVPFCVLDEIDSSLDENNLTNFLHFLKEFTSNTQFVIITHKRRTMEEADILYGVTMEEQGVSKVISLNLSQKAG